MTQRCNVIIRSCACFSTPDCVQPQSQFRCVNGACVDAISCRIVLFPGAEKPVFATGGHEQFPAYDQGIGGDVYLAGNVRRMETKVDQPLPPPESHLAAQAWDATNDTTSNPTRRRSLLEAQRQ